MDTERLKRFMSHVRRNQGCWTWMGSQNGFGYGTVKVDGKLRAAHRYHWELVNGPVPPSLDLDHRCRNRRCVRIDHLEPVTRRENLLRAPRTLASIMASRTHCPRGHEYNEENTRIMRGQRHCKRCAVIRNRAWVERVKERARAELAVST